MILLGKDYSAHAESLIHDYPERAFAITPAVDAHNRGEYALSVPLFFAQAEGISFATINKYIFTNGRSKGAVDENIKNDARLRLKAINELEDCPPAYKMMSAFVEFMWIPFAEPLPVAYSEKARELNQYEGLIAILSCTVSRLASTRRKKIVCGHFQC